MNKVKLVKFALVGGIGFIADTTIFILLYQLIGIDILQARVLAFVVAATTTWCGNRCFTFSNRPLKNRFAQWIKFVTVACISALPNFLVFKLVANQIGSYFLGVYIALAIGVLVGMMSNYLLSDRWVFAK